MSTTVEPIEKGGSGRKFWRIRTGSESCILVRYSLDRADNAGYADVARFLSRVGVRVPEIFLHDPDRKSTRLNSSHLRLSRMPSSA